MYTGRPDCQLVFPDRTGLPETYRLQDVLFAVTGPHIRPRDWMHFVLRLPKQILQIDVCPSAHLGWTGLDQIVCVQIKLDHIV